MTERLQQGIAGTIYAGFTVDGDEQDPTPDQATVTLTRASDGSLLGPHTANDVDDPAGEFTHTLTEQETTSLDWLTASWAIPYAGTQTFTTYVEVVGGLLFTIPAARRQLKALRDEDEYTARDIADARTIAEEALEDACGIAFVPRFRREEHTLSRAHLKLDRRHVRALRSISIDGVAFTAEQVAAVAFTPNGWITLGWPGTRVVVGYEHGLDRPPGPVSRAAMILAKEDLVHGPVSDRAIQRDTEFGPIALATPGLRGARFGIPEVDAVVTQYHRTTGLE